MVGDAEETEVPAVPTPGWYPDAERADQLRWWDGERWTDDVHVLAAAGEAGEGDEGGHHESSAAAPDPDLGAAAAGAAGGRGRRVLVAVAVVIVVVAAAAGGFVAARALGGDDDVAGRAPVGPASSSGELFLEGRADPGPDPYSGPLGVPSTFLPTPVDLDAAPKRTGARTEVAAVHASTAGLYGDAGPEACDVQVLLDRLDREPAKRGAFADARGVDGADLEAHLWSLRPLVLSRDTRVTTHGYAGNGPSQRQSVLQAGTAVLVDQHGAPAVRCPSGSPLSGPEALGEHTATGPRWPGYDPSEVVVITPSAEPLDGVTVQTPDGLDEIPLGPPALEDVDFGNRAYPDTCFDGFYGPKLEMVDGGVQFDDGTNAAAGALVSGPFLLDGTDDPLAAVLVTCVGRTDSTASAMYLFGLDGRTPVLRRTIPLDISSPDAFSTIVDVDGLELTTLSFGASDYGDGAAASWGTFAEIDRYRLDPEAATLERINEVTYRVPAEAVTVPDADEGLIERITAELRPACAEVLARAPEVLTELPKGLYRVDDGRLVAVHLSESGHLILEGIVGEVSDQEATTAMQTFDTDLTQDPPVAMVYRSGGRVVCSVPE